MTMSCHGKAFSITGPLCRESTGHWRILIVKGQACRPLMFHLLLASVSSWAHRRMLIVWDAIVHNDELVQERRNPIANALELRLSCTHPSKCDFTVYRTSQKGRELCMGTSLMVAVTMIVIGLTLLLSLHLSPDVVLDRDITVSSMRMPMFWFTNQCYRLP